jgi:hypothetical protein
MEIKIRLKKLLGEHGLDGHGIIQQIAADIGVNRHTIAKLYNNQAPTLSLDLLSRLCTWLHSHGVPSGELPGDLFSTGRAALWEALVLQGEEITLYLGEYHATKPPFAASRWISTRDSAVASTILRQLSTGTEARQLWPGLRLAYVPFRYSPGDANLDQSLLHEDIARAGELFSRVKGNPEPCTTIIIGSQRVNYLLEFFVADLFGCQPFTTAAKDPAVPFFSVYRQTDRNTPSCFGGPHNPFRQTDGTVPGLHYLNEKGKWVTCPWVEKKQDAGIVITLKDHRTKSIILAVFGFSGLATKAVGDQLVHKEHQFWPPPMEFKSREVGVHLCQLTYVPSDGTDELQEDSRTSTCEVVTLGDRMLKQFLR